MIGSMLITGGAGLLGSRLAVRAIADGWEVTVTTRRTEPPAGPSVEQIDLTDPAATRALVERIRPDVIVHAAYDKGDNGPGSVTVAGTQALVDAHAGPVVLTSTDLVFAGRGGPAYTEGDEPDPAIDYGRAKRVAERSVLTTPDGLVVRLPLLVDTVAGEQVDLVRAAVRGGATLFTDEIRTPAMVDDVATSILGLVELRHRGVVHLGGAAAVDRGTLGRLLAPHLGLDPATVTTGPTPTSLVATGRPGDVRLDSSLADGLGLRPRSIVDALTADVTS
ncbi:MAG: sugar nucleotide-binding protein [Actinomycetota bacterium]